jgi:tRNA-splicing ligase RtcB
MTVEIKSWVTNIEEGALKQAKNLAELPFVFKHVALMPDCHQGYGMPIGGVLATTGVVIPNAVGVDIGCGMIAVKTNIVGIDKDRLKSVMGKVRKAIPVGFNRHSTTQYWIGFNDAPDNHVVQRELDKARYQLGTLGGGNHFIEFQEDGEQNLWVMIHSGSRNFGLQVAEYYHGLAQRVCRDIDLPDNDLAYLQFDSGAGQEYFEAMNYCLSFAQANRDLMMRRIHEILGCLFTPSINIHHNYASVETHYGESVIVHRKGATSAKLGETGIIPGSMGTSSYITEGLGNPDSFMSCSHGAGRRMGRGQATRSLDLATEQSRMGNIVHGLRSIKNLDEAPGAYKDIDGVMENQKDLVKILIKLTPIGSIKG